MVRRVSLRRAAPARGSGHAYEVAAAACGWAGHACEAAVGSALNASGAASGGK